MELFFYILGYLCLILIGFKVHKAIKMSKANFKYLVVNFLALFLFAVLLLVGLSNEFSNFANDELLTRVLFFIIVIYLFYVSFIASLNIAVANKRIEVLASEVAILKEEVETHIKKAKHTSLKD